MKVKVAETAGFCFGVKRAVDKVSSADRGWSFSYLYSGTDHPQ